MRCQNLVVPHPMDERFLGTGTGKRPLNGRKILVVAEEQCAEAGLCWAIAEAGGTIEGPLRETGYPTASDCDIAVFAVGDCGPSVTELAEALQWKGVPLVFATRQGLTLVPDRLKHVPVWLEPYRPAHLVFGLAMLLDLRSGGGG
jgi:hypothetical protein